MPIETLFIMIFIALVAGLIQAGLFVLTKRRFTMLFIPIVFAIPSIFLIAKYADTSILAQESTYFFTAVLFGVPIVIGSFLSGVIIMIKGRQGKWR